MKKLMTMIDTKLLEKVVYNLCLQAGQELSPYSYNIISKAYKETHSLRLAHILQNAKKAHEISRPLCQDTGTVHIFMEVGNEVSFSSNPTDAINEGVKKCYVEKYFRKSVVENELISGKNRETNTPALINIDYVSGNSVKINVLLKGAGCDNVSEVKMMLPTTSEKEFVNFAVNTILEKGKNACPPVFVSIAAGTGAESVMLEAEKGYFSEKTDLPELVEKIKSEVKEKADKKFEGFYLADLKITAKPHHMASLPIAIAFNCHSLRIASATICRKNVSYSEKISKFEKIKEEKISEREVSTFDLEAVKNLKEGENVLLTGEILIARDAAHKKMMEYKLSGIPLPFELKDQFVFYAAPCPAMPDEIVGSIGPTTSNRMDKFLPEFPQVAATLGKGGRSAEAADFIRKNNSVYFEIEGGIATLLSSCFESYETVAFEELSTEAVCRAKINKLPAKVVFAKQN